MNQTQQKEALYPLTLKALETMEEISATDLAVSSLSRIGRAERRVLEQELSLIKEAIMFAQGGARIYLGGCGRTFYVDDSEERRN